MALERGALGICIASALAVGGMWPLGQAICAFAAVALLMVLGGVHAAANLRWRWNPVAVTLFVMAAMTLARGLPLFGFLGGDLADAAGALWGRTASATAAPVRLPLAALRLLGVGALLQLWTLRFRNSGGLARALKTVGVLIAVVFGVGVLHELGGIEGVFGLFAPVDIGGLRHPLSAPFVNENQVGALYCLGAVVLACVAHGSVSHRLSALAGCAALFAVSAFVFHAYAAVAAAVVALAAFAVVSVLPIRANRTYVRVLLGVGCVAVLGMAIGAWWVLPHLSLGTAGAKAQVWNDAIGAIVTRPLGMGPGVWPDVAGAFMSTPVPQRSAWVEATVLDAALDHGWILILIVLLNAGRSLYQRLESDRREERDVRAATLAVSVFVAGEAVSGMAMESMTYAFAVLVLFGFAAGRAETRRAFYRSPARVVSGCSAVALLAALSIPGLAASVRMGDGHAGTAIGVALEQQGALSPEFEQTLRALGEQVPIDPVLLTFVADLALVHRDVPRAQQVSAHLVRFTPGRPQTWRIAVAVAMAAEDRDAACAAAASSRTTSNDPTRFTANLRLIVENPREWPDCAPGADALHDMYAGLLLEGNRTQALALAMRTLRDNPDDASSLRAAVEGLYDLGDAEYGVQLASRLLALEPSDVRTASLGARMLIGLERPAEALELLDLTLAEVPRNIDLSLTRLEALAAVALADETEESHEAFSAYYARLLALVSGDPPAAIARLRIAGRYMVTTHRWRDAENAYQALLRLAPEDPQAHAALTRIHQERAVRGSDAP